jgi:HSP20 family molecular chaperone IbpA
VYDDPQSTRISATLELPGLQKEDLSIDREGDRLIVSGERRSPVPEDSARLPRNRTERRKLEKLQRVDRAKSRQEPNGRLLFCVHVHA